MKNAELQINKALDRLYLPELDLPEHTPQISGYFYRDEKGIYWIMKQGNAYIKKYINAQP
jgi:hypothetical protein